MIYPVGRRFSPSRGRLPLRSCLVGGSYGTRSSVLRGPGVHDGHGHRGRVPEPGAGERADQRASARRGQEERG